MKRFGSFCLVLAVLFLPSHAFAATTPRVNDRVVVRGTHTAHDGRYGTVVRILSGARRRVALDGTAKRRAVSRTFSLRNLREASKSTTDPSPPAASSEVAKRPKTPPSPTPTPTAPTPTPTPGIHPDADRHARPRPPRPRRQAAADTAHPTATPTPTPPAGPGDVARRRWRPSWYGRLLEPILDRHVVLPDRRLVRERDLAGATSTRTRTSGLNTYVVLTGNSNLSLVRNNGMRSCCSTAMVGHSPDRAPRPPAGNYTTRSTCR